MTVAFDEALATVLFHEGYGRYTNDPVDPGGATRWGISLRFLQNLGDADNDGWRDGDLNKDGDVDAKDIRLMTRGQAEKIYRVQFWDRYKYGRLHSGRVAGKIFDLAVNMGPYNAHKVLQRACRACEHEIVVDGIIGPKTIAAANSCAPPLPRPDRRAQVDPLLAACRATAAGHYLVLVARCPVFVKYIKGWEARAYS